MGYWINETRTGAEITKSTFSHQRFSVEWSKLEPSRGAWDKSAIEHYRS
jgi:hypothetical protein